MDNKVLRLQYAYLRLIDAQEGKLSHRDEPLDWERVHMASCSRLARSYSAPAMSNMPWMRFSCVAPAT